MKLKPLPKLLLIGAAVGAAYFGINFLMSKGYLSGKATVAVSVPDKIDLPAAGGGVVATGQQRQSQQMVAVKTFV